MPVASVEPGEPVPASVVTPHEVLRCASPTAAAAGAESTLVLDFEDADDKLYELRGSARRQLDGTLTLTEADYHQTGIIIISPPIPERASHFQVNFDAFIGGGTGGDGMSFCYGELNEAHSRGLFDTDHGLCVHFWTRDEHQSRHEAVDVVSDGILLRSEDVRGQRSRLQVGCRAMVPSRQYQPAILWLKRA